MVYGCTQERVSIDGEYSGKIFDTDLSAVAATYIHWRLPGLGSRVAVTLSPSLGADLLGCRSQYKRKEWKGMKGSNQTTVWRTQSYERISPTTDRYSSMATFRQIWCTGKLHLHWQVVKTHADAICTGPKSNKKRRGEKRREGNNGTKGNGWTASISSAPPLPNSYSTDHPYP